MADNKFTAPDALARCEPMSRLQSVIGGKWKILILWYVAAYGVQRFNELQRRLAGASHTTLTASCAARCTARCRPGWNTACPPWGRASRPCSTPCSTGARNIWRSWAVRPRKLPGKTGENRG